MTLTPRKRLSITLAATLTFGLLSACGGETMVADGGIRGTGSSVGPVSGFGSVFVNGVEFFTDGIRGREVESNDGIETEGDLDEGMILRIEGEWRVDGTGAAESMDYDDTLRGTISNLVRGASGEPVTFEIHGQPVFADRQTVFKGKTLATLANGDFVRVSAWRQPDGSYRASYIGFNPALYGDDRIEVEGPVDEGSVEAGQFKMNGVVIKFDDRSFAEGLSVGDLKPGLYFEVEGSKELAGNAVAATRIQLDDFRRYRPIGKDIELAGPVSSNYNATDKTFGLNGLTIQIADSTELDDIALEDLQEGLLVQVEGESVSGNLIRATEIEARDGDAEISGAVGMVEPGTSSLTLGGVSVLVTSRTIITDDDEGDRLTINDLIPGANNVFVEIAGLVKEDRNGAVYIEAVQVELESSGDADKFEIEGVLAQGDLTLTSIRMLGVSITASDPVFDGITRAELLDLLENGEKVVVEVTYKKEPTSPSGYEALSIELD
ncbi:DUF5666 domain-containing protein [uncultured Marinobacter sp.]|uniref:DUF5666 domain-containing protein n=1 Tax=uncultured Marinobacter sp. TaxID=187379 RepID=UPI0030DA4AA5